MLRRCQPALEPVPVGADRPRVVVGFLPTGSDQVIAAPELRQRLADHRYHQLTIEDESRDGQSATVVHVVLFGGIVDAKVQVTDRVVPHADIPPTRIEF